ncbi:hypothetical protein BH11PLA2_BH11PLA2_04330 [soil metagenome]
MSLVAMSASVSRRCPTLPESVIGVDLVFVSHEAFKKQDDSCELFSVVPELCVEIIATNDIEELMRGKIQVYLECGVEQIWIVDPDHQSIAVHCSNDTILQNAIPANSAMPGFTPTVAELFEE